MTDTRPRINSAEVADYMLSINRPISAPELTTILSRLYPHLLVENHDIYIRLRGFYVSDQAECVMNNDVRPRTFHLKSISCRYFKFRHGRKTDISQTAIVRDHANMPNPWKKLTKRQRDKAMREVRALYQSIQKDLVHKRMTLTV
ncbi:hypothetical protein O3W44_22485 [Pantoea sp. LMR881]|uniref:hypothetical protein n=1 Tax=Pantoea sp. LMR881 TaxID=3014336 RepID=UPI0022B0261B|nr:hypothetical protein [Pantoea sp. LMR881]MCZ4061191.1 hypothetical protein [Pantoea sp. LMR881]MCZ4061302.1 hypothetical protein [Pantoea sp. LMR881]